MNIRNYETKDQQTVLKIFSDYPNIFPKIELDILNQELIESDPNHLKYVFVDNEIVVGFASLKLQSDSATTWCVNWLAVAPASQHKSIGTTLLNHLFKTAQDKGIKQLFVETCSCVDETPARNLYKKIGFQQCGLLPEYYYEGHSKIILHKKFI